MNNLPAELTSFIGRERELAEVKRRLGSTRLLTLSGSGGVGKTRLARRLASEVGKSYPDGVWMVELASLRDPGSISQAVASVFGLHDDQTGSVWRGLTEHLQPRRLLLFLDNCEHLLEASAELAVRLLTVCPSLTVLTTSREPLNVPGEVAWLVPPLALPNRDEPLGLERQRQAESLRLFAERATAADPAFSLTEENAAAVTRICRRLDGIPLAIELAAVRTRVLTVEQIAGRLDDRFRLLSGGGRGSVPRHVTLRSSVDWSYDLLSEQERVLFRRLAVFVGGWTLEAAEDVAGNGGHGGEPPSSAPSLESCRVLDLLTALIEKSLVIRVEWDGEARYNFLETIRRYAEEKLCDSGEQPELRRRHARWFLEQAQLVRPGLVGPELSGRFKRIEADHDNLRAALDWCEADDVLLGLELAGRLMHYWYRLGYLAEGRKRLTALLARCNENSEACGGSQRWLVVRARAILAAGRLAMRQGSGDAAVLLDEAVILARELGDHAAVASALSFRGRLLYWQNDLSGAISRLQEALAIARDADEPMTVAHALHGLGMAFQALGDCAKAETCYEEERVLAHELDDPWLLAIALHQRALLAIDMGELEDARQLLQEAISIRRRDGDRVLSVRLLEAAANLALAEGRSRRALRLAAAASVLGEVYGDAVSERLRTSFVERLAAARRDAGEGAAARAWSEGKVLSAEQALEYALAAESEDESVPGRSSAGRPSHESLTPRERDVTVLLARGLTNREIAQTLVVSDGTAKIHVERILRKLGMRSRAEVAAWAVSSGFANAPTGAC